MARVSPYEHDILKAVAGGWSMDQLVNCPKWTINDVAVVLRNHNLTADPTGRIVRNHKGPDPILQIALASPNQHVRTKALRAQALLNDLAKHVAAEQDARIAEADRARQRQSLIEWQSWLTQAQADARMELRRLNLNSKTTAAGAL